jgi:hypothetical protein
VFVFRGSDKTIKQRIVARLCFFLLLFFCHPSRPHFPAHPTQTAKGYHPDGQNGYDTELHALAAILSTSVVGVGDWLGMTDGPLLRRLAREDGILLKPDRPLAPMDAMFGGPAGAARAMPDYPTGARLWATHASVAPEDETTAPELATAPTRRLVSHSAVAASLHRASADALATAGPHHLQYMVVAVDVRTSWTLQATDLYPAVPGGAQLLYRSFHAPACQNGSAAVASGCMTSAATSALMDISLDKAECRTSGRCHHDVAMWQVRREAKTVGLAFVVLCFGGNGKSSGKRHLPRFIDILFSVLD